MARWYVYILKCGDGTLYTGVATDVARRLHEHQNGTGAKYTRGRGPLRLVRQEQSKNRSAALKRELQVKKLTRAQKLGLIRLK